MTIAELTTFLGWCTVINSGLLFFWGIVLAAVPDLAYQLQIRFTTKNMERKEWDLIMYGFLAVFKILVVVFNLVPWIALKMMA